LAIFQRPVKDKLFYFGSFEATLERAGISPSPFSVPTEAIRAGNFSGLPVTLYDPLTGNPDGTGRLPFAENRIPAARISPISRRIQEKAPLPNLPGVSLGTLSNYFNSGTEKLDRKNYDAKINWNPRSALAIFGKYSRMDAPVSSKFALGEVGGLGLSRAGVGTGDTNVNIITLGHTWTLSPTLVLDSTFGYTKFDQSVVGPDHGKNIGSEVWGIPNTNDPIVTGFAGGAEQVKKACPPGGSGSLLQRNAYDRSRLQQLGQHLWLAAVVPQGAGLYLHHQCHAYPRSSRGALGL